MSLTLNEAQINSAARGNEKDLREMLSAVKLALEGVYAQTGTGPVKKVDSTANAYLSAPPKCGFSVTGANGKFSYSITLPQQASGSTAPKNVTNAGIYQEISSSTSPNFTASVTTYPITNATSGGWDSPGATLFWRLRSSYDQKTWNAYAVLPGGAVSAGLQTSAASEPATVLNQTNFSRIDSVGAGSTATIRIYGSGGVGTAWTYGSGANSKVIPGGTIMNVTYGILAYGAWSGTQYEVKPSLSQVLPDSWLPVGSVSVISNGAGLVLPTIVPVITGGHIIGYNITNGGNDITGTLSFAIADTGGGTGASVGAATVSGGILTALGAGNPGANYTGATTVTASGGVSGGVSGGGGPLAGNGGRLFGLTTNGA